MDGALQSVQVNIMNRESRNKAFIEVVIEKKMGIDFPVLHQIWFVLKKSQNQVDQEHSVIQ